jgi:heptosyltransferase-1
VALVHGTSRTDKQWPLAHWIELGQRLNACGYRVALPHGSDVEQQQAQAIANGLAGGLADSPARAVIWPRQNLAALTDALVGCAGVIGVDSGLSHLALALDLAHVQIYNFDSAWRTGPLHRARQRSVFAQPSPSVDAVWQAWLAVSETAVAKP